MLLKIKYLNTNKEGRLDEAAAIPSCLPNS